MYQTECTYIRAAHIVEAHQKTTILRSNHFSTEKNTTKVNMILGRVMEEGNEPLSSLFLRLSFYFFSTHFDSLSVFYEH